MRMLFPYPALLYVIFSWLSVGAGPVRAENDRASQLKFIPIPSGVLPSNEVRILYQDSDGYIWLPTYSGLARYDGYSIVNYGLNSETGETFDAYVNVVAEDKEKNLWVATEKGVFRLHKPSGRLSRAGNERIEALNVSDIICAADGTIWFGSDQGLFRRQPGTDTFERIDFKGKPLNYVTSLLEDDRRNVWVTVSEVGLFRYETDRNEFYFYNDSVLHAANVVFQDHRSRIWVGTWGKGLLKLENPYTEDGRMHYDRYRHDKRNSRSLLDDIVYSLEQDRQQRLWIGSRSGLSILHDENDPYAFENFVPGDAYGSLPYNEVSSILRTRDNQMWISMFGGGACKIQTESDTFEADRMEAVKERYKTSSVRSIFYAGDDEYWMGVIGFGMIRYNGKTRTCLNYSEHPDLKNFPYTSTVDAIIRRKKTGEICFGTYSQGVWIYDESKHTVRVLDQFTEPAFKDVCVHTLMEDSEGNLWIGTRRGIYILDTEGRFRTLSDWLPGIDTGLLDSRIFDIEEDAGKNIWIATNYEGIVRIDRAAGSCRRYTVGQGGGVKNIFCLLVDSRQRVWAGSMWNGLAYYDRESDSFVTIPSFSSVENKGIFNMVEDDGGRIWITTGNAVVSFGVDESYALEHVRYYAVSDGSESFFFNRNACLKMPDGKIWFGGTHGLRIFTPSRPENDEPAVYPLVFTDFKIHNRSLRDFPPGKRARVTDRDIDYAGVVTLTHRDHNFTIEFSLLNYVNPQENMYTYRLEGYDPQEIVVDAQRHFASYSNLKPGTYTFRLKATSEDGVWNGTERTLQIRVLPAPYLSGWAYLLYALVFTGILYFVVRFIRYRIRLRNEIRMNKLEQQKIREINQVKLRFFTNVTHELMTPLSIILASLENLKHEPADRRSLYAVMAANATRLMRLIQQVLEFRKVESGNLKICVSPGDLTTFVKNCAEAFMPLVRKKRLRVAFHSDPESVSGFFDPDKLDKILYNLLSNAAKYTPEGGRINIRLCRENEHTVRIEIANTGERMSAEVIGQLFRRFYEGDYRKYHTIGTGIGLSLVRDLVEIHRGTIDVVSDETAGNCFRVRLPVGREAYRDNEIDETVTPQAPTAFVAPVYAEEEAVAGDECPGAGPSDYTVLIVDDNEELCALYSSLLANYFQVKTAPGGREAVEVLEQGNIDLVVSDIMMPGMDGIELCRYIKSRFEFCHIPVVLLTAKRTEESQIEGFQSGADGYVSKPCNFSLLYAQIVNLLKKRERQGADFRKQLVFEVGELDYTSMDEAFLQQAIDCVNAHLDDCAFGQAGFVQEMATSRTVLTEKLKSLTGLTPAAFVLNVRLTAACKLMDEQKKIRVADLAYAVGFNDPKYFSTCFKKKYGLSPKEYMDRLGA